MDIAAAKKRCEAATHEPWDWGDSYTLLDQWGRDVTALVANRSFIRYARTDLPAALEALEEIGREVQDWADDERAWYCRSKIEAILRGSKGGELT